MRSGSSNVEDIKDIFKGIIFSAGWTSFNNLQRLTGTHFVIAMTASQYYNVFGQILQTNRALWNLIALVCIWDVVEH